jgi:hypothetical protein
MDLLDSNAVTLNYSVHTLQFTTVDHNTRLHFTAFTGNCSSACVPLHCLLSAECTVTQSHVTTDDQSVSKSSIRAPSGSHDRTLISVWHLLFYLTAVPIVARVTVAKAKRLRLRLPATGDFPLLTLQTYSVHVTIWCFHRPYFPLS